MLQLSDLKIAVIGLGYVGLPLAVEFGKKEEFKEILAILRRQNPDRIRVL